MFLFEATISTVGLMTVLTHWSFLIIIFAACILLNAILYQTILISPEEWQWNGLGGGTIALACALLFTLMLVMLDNGTFNDYFRSTQTFRRDKYDKFGLQNYQFDEHQQSRYFFSKIFLFGTVVVHLYTHYHYCKLNVNYLEAKKEFGNHNFLFKELNSQVSLTTKVI